MHKEIVRILCLPFSPTVNLQWFVIRVYAFHVRAGDVFLWSGEQLAYGCLLLWLYQIFYPAPTEERFDVVSWS